MSAEVIELKSDAIKETIELLDSIDQLNHELDESKKPWKMTAIELKMAHADGDINLNTYIKWAVRFDYGMANRPSNVTQIDCKFMANRWSYEIFNTKNKLKQLELQESDVMRIILILAEKGWFSFVLTPRQIELDLYPVKD